MAAVTPWGGGSASGAAPAGGGERGAVVPRSGCPRGGEVEFGGEKGPQGPLRSAAGRGTDPHPPAEGRELRRSPMEEAAEGRTQRSLRLRGGRAG